MLFKNALVLDETFQFKHLDLRVDEDKITDITFCSPVCEAENAVDLTGMYLIPGLVDMHIHGFGGVYVMDADYNAFNGMSIALSKEGVTSFAATTTTIDKYSIINALTNIKNAKQSGLKGAKIQGVYLEGPFISGKYKGAMQGKYILEPDAEVFKEFLSICNGLIKVIAIAPEKEGAFDFIKECVKYDVIPSIAHTASDYDKAVEAIHAGVSNATHLFNAMIGLNHREPGVIGAIFDSNITAEIICDGKHIHPAVIRTVYKILGNERMILISDAIPYAGLGDGEFIMNGVKSIVKDGTSRLENGTINGNVNSLTKGVKKAVEFGISLEDAVKMATINPAKKLKIEKKVGSISIGKYADLAVLNKNLEVRYTFVNGKCVFKA